MRYFGFIVFTMLSCLAEAQTQEQRFLIEHHHAGPVFINADAYLLYQSFPRRSRQLVDLALEGQLSPALVFSLPDSPASDGVVAELIPSGDRLVVFRISIYDPMLRTVEGIGVGSTVGELRAEYELNRVATGEGRVFVVVDELSASFELDQARHRDLWRLRDPQELPDDVRIIRVLLTR